MDRYLFCFNTVVGRGFVNFYVIGRYLIGKFDLITLMLIKKYVYK